MALSWVSAVSMSILDSLAMIGSVFNLCSAVGNERGLKIERAAAAQQEEQFVEAAAGGYILAVRKFQQGPQRVAEAALPSGRVIGFSTRRSGISAVPLRFQARLR